MRNRKEKTRDHWQQKTFVHPISMALRLRGNFTHFTLLAWSSWSFVTLVNLHCPCHCRMSATLLLSFLHFRVKSIFKSIDFLHLHQLWYHVCNIFSGGEEDCWGGGKRRCWWWRGRRGGRRGRSHSPPARRTCRWPWRPCPRRPRRRSGGAWEEGACWSARLHQRWGSVQLHQLARGRWS